MKKIISLAILICSIYSTNSHSQEQTIDTEKAFAQLYFNKDINDRGITKNAVFISTLQSADDDKHMDKYFLTTSAYVKEGEDLDYICSSPMLECSMKKDCPNLLKLGAPNLILSFIGEKNSLMTCNDGKSLLNVKNLVIVPAVSFER